MKIQAIDLNSPFLADVKKIGKENATTLGFFPEGAFDERAKERQILVAINDNEQFVGYLLYRVGNRQAKIVHLCINKTHRNSGAGRKLVEHLKVLTSDLLGISLKCRRDSKEAAKLWETCRFIPIAESRGRGKTSTILVHWWLSHGHPTLFDKCLEEQNKNKIDIVVDANVFYDFDNPTRQGYEESNSLKADWLEDSLNICVVDELYQEINHSEDQEIRTTSREKASQYTILSCDKNRADAIYTEIKSFYPIEESKLSKRDKSDIRQVAEAISGEAQYFITRDATLLKEEISNKVFDKYGIKILRPSDFIIHIDEFRRESEYQPARLSGTELKIALVNSGQEKTLFPIFTQQESKSSFQNRLRAYLSDINKHTCKQVVDEFKNPLALFVYKKTDESSNEIPLLRVKKSKLSSTLARHLIVEAIHDSITENKTSTKITDSYLTPEIKTGLLEAGFINSENVWTKFHLKSILPKNEVSKQLSKITTETDEQKRFLNDLGNILNRNYHDLNADIFADVERSLYPIKITDSLLPCFTVPIQPQWAKELFDRNLANQGLFGAKRDLALRKEQVYYRRKKNSHGLGAPSRILWYVSLGTNKYYDVGAIRACSLVDEVVIGKPKVLYNLYKRLGIYSWDDVYETAEFDINNEIMAVRFSHTELFPNPIKRERILEIIKNNNCNWQYFSPHQIQQEVFIEIYKEGTISTN